MQRAADMADDLLQQKESRAQAGEATTTEQWVLDMEVCLLFLTPGSNKNVLSDPNHGVRPEESSRSLKACEVAR